MSPGSALASSLIQTRARKGTLWGTIDKLERVAALAALILLAPLLLVVAIAIAALSRRTPLVAHLRVGQFGVPLWTLKFRTMWPADPAGLPKPDLIEYIVDESGMDYKSAWDPRVTSRFATLCRRYSIDELPQLFHVASGKMSLVGPRPLTEGELKKHYGYDAALILQEKPGITGLWQVQGRSRLTYEERRTKDLFLVQNRSVKLYLTILLRTMAVVVRAQDGW